MRKSKLSFIFILMILFTYPGNALAHKVTVFAWVDGETVHTESKFNGGRKVNGGDITVFDSLGNVLLSGKTNDEGEFSFKIPQKTEMRIELTAGMGHKGEWTITPDEIEEISPESPDNVKHQAVPGVKTNKSAPVQAGLSASEIQVIMEKTLDKKLKPVIKMLADSQEKGPSVNDIFGGIGYILGLMGIVMYFKARQIKGK